MNEALLGLVPKRYLCPYCGEWHNNPYAFSSLENCISEDPFKRGCDVSEKAKDDAGEYRFYFEDGYFHYSTIRLCAVKGLDGCVPIHDFVESEDEPIVTVNVGFRADRNINSYACMGCGFCTNCNYFNSVDSSDDRSMTITLGFEFDKKDYEKVVGHKLGQPYFEQRKTYSKSKAQNGKLGDEEHLPKTSDKEDTTMAKKNNMFGMNVEFGLNKDENLKSTLMGVAVKTDDGWRVYNQSKNEITDIGDMELGNLPIYIIPTTKLKQGDLIKDGDEYYFVREVGDGGVNRTLSVKTGEIKTVIPIKNVMGFGIYSKVKALTEDFLAAEEGIGVEKMVLMSAMFGGEDDKDSSSNNSINQMLPFLMLKDSGEDNDKMLIMAAAMNSTCPENQGINQMLPLLMLKDSGEDNDKMLMMAAMMNGNGSGSNNPMLMYMLMKNMMGGNKLDAEATKQTATSSKSRSSGKKKTTPALPETEKTPNGDEG